MLMPWWRFRYDLNELEREIPALSVKELVERMERESDNPFLKLLDVREDREVRSGIIPGAIHIPLGSVEAEVGNHLTDTSLEVVVYCASGRRSLVGAKILLEQGFTKVFNLTEGYQGFQAIK